MAVSARDRLAALRAYLERCHARHPTVCLACWAVGSFQVSQALAIWATWMLGIAYHPMQGILL
jgi:hypothetical protein